MNRDVYDKFIQEVTALTIDPKDNAVKVVGDLTRAVKRAQRNWYIEHYICPECAHNYHGMADCRVEPFPDDPGLCHTPEGER